MAWTTSTVYRPARTPPGIAQTTVTTEALYQLS